MNALRTAFRPVPSCIDLRATLVRAAAVCIGLALAACGGSADAPAPPETVPVVLTQPADASVIAGSPAVFTVDAAGAAPLAYQWSSSADGTTFVAIPGATDDRYDTGATTLGESGTSYRVVVSNSLGSVTSSAALLTVTPAPVAPAITVQPSDQTVTAPATATFSVTASGTAPAYEWQSSGDGGATFVPVAGAPSQPTLALANTTPAQSGQRYRVRVSNAAGSVTSDAALLTVNAAPSAPQFTMQPSAQSVVAGGAATFVVAVTGTPAPTLQWRLGGAALADGVQASGVCAGATVAGATSATLALSAVPLGCSGAVFSAVASNGVSPDATSAGATLTVSTSAAAPIVSLQPADISVVAPAAAGFTAAATGVPAPTVQWQQSSDAGVTWTNITGATSASYATPATVLADSGKRFRAVFANASGSAISNAAVLTVTGAPPAAALSQPQAVAFDAAGNAYVADTFNHTIRKVTPAGVVSTLAGLSGTAGNTDGPGVDARFDTPRGLAVDAAGTVYVADTFNGAIRKITPAGVVSTLTSALSSPHGIALDGAGNVYVAELSLNVVRKVTSAGVVSTLAGLAGNPGSADGNGSAARFRSPSSVALDAAGNVYVTDTFNYTIRKITPAGDVTTIAGVAQVFGSVDGNGSAARFRGPRGIAVDAAGNLYVGDTENHTIRRITPAGDVTTVAGLALSPGSVDGTGSAARFNEPMGIAFDGLGNAHVADSKNNAVRRVTPSGVVTTVVH